MSQVTDVLTHIFSETYLVSDLSNGEFLPSRLRGMDLEHYSSPDWKYVFRICFANEIHHGRLIWEYNAWVYKGRVYSDSIRNIYSTALTMIFLILQISEEKMRMSFPLLWTKLNFYLLGMCAITAIMSYDVR